jgi:hypothetical protein
MKNVHISKKSNSKKSLDFEKPETKNKEKR